MNNNIEWCCRIKVTLRHFYTTFTLVSGLTYHTYNKSKKIIVKLAIPFSDKCEHICLIKRVTRLLIIPSRSSRFLPIDRRFFNETSEKKHNNLQCGWQRNMVMVTWVTHVLVIIFHNKTLKSNGNNLKLKKWKLRFIITHKLPLNVRNGD